MRAVITGGPSVGKTTIINELAARGFKIVEEFATQIIKEGKILPWEDRIGFQEEVLRRQLRAEAAVKSYPGPVFLDRGSFDGEAYYIYDKLEIPSIFHKLDPAVYSIAFLIEELPTFEENGIRFENLEFTRELTKVLEFCYKQRNIEVVRVPALPAQERTDFVVAQFEKHCLHAARAKASQVTVSRNSSVAPTMLPAFAV